MLVGLIVATLGCVLLQHLGTVFVGNYLWQPGAIGNVLAGSRPNLFSEPLWLLLNAMAITSGVAFGVGAAGAAKPLRTWSGPRQPVSSLLISFSLLMLLELVAYAVLVEDAFFDRYLWPVIFTIAVLVVQGLVHGADHQPARAAHISAAAALGSGLLLATAFVTLNADAFTEAAWSAGLGAVHDLGFPAARVDAGFAWVGDHQGGYVVANAQPTPGSPVNTWYLRLFPRLRACAVVADSRLEDNAAVLERRLSYNLLAFGVPEPLYVYRLRSARCPDGGQG